MAMSFFFNSGERGRYRTVKKAGMLFLNFFVSPNWKIESIHFTLINFVLTLTSITYFFYSLFFLVHFSPFLPFFIFPL